MQKLSKKDNAHDFEHHINVENIAKNIAKHIEKTTKLDIEIIEMSSLLHDIASLEDRFNHTQAGAKIAKTILNEIDFPLTKIEKVCDIILNHEKRNPKQPSSIEESIMRDADFIESLGLGYVARSIAWGFQSEHYKRPMFVNKNLKKIDDSNKNDSTIHYLLYRLNDPALNPSTCFTKEGRRIAQQRYNNMKKFVMDFIDEGREYQ